MPVSRLRALVSLCVVVAVEEVEGGRSGGRKGGRGARGALRPSMLLRRTPVWQQVESVRGTELLTDWMDIWACYCRSSSLVREPARNAKRRRDGPFVPERRGRRMMG